MSKRLPCPFRVPVPELRIQVDQCWLAPCSLLSCFVGVALRGHPVADFLRWGATEGHPYNHAREFLKMKYQLVILALAVLALTQMDEIKLDAAQSKITTVSAMRVRKTPQISGEEVVRLKLGTVVNAIARSTNQDTIAGKTDYWYRVNLP